MFDSFKELFSSTFNTAVQRVRNPALGAFALSWAAFNWKSILYLLFSDAAIVDKISYISDHSTWRTVIGYPCVSVIIICGFLPWVNNVISMWQSKPLDNNDSIENLRNAKRIHRATRLQRLRAKHDVTYDRVKAGSEKEIQEMRENILQSQERMGAITAERDKLLKDNAELEKMYKIAKSSVERFSTEAMTLERVVKEQKETIENNQKEINSLNGSLNKLISDRDPVAIRVREGEMARAMSDAAKGSYSPD